MVKICHKCGMSYDDTSFWCNKCGEQIIKKPSEEEDKTNEKKKKNRRSKLKNMTVLNRMMLH